MWLLKLRHKIFDVVEANTHIHKFGFQIIEVGFDPHPKDLLDASDYSRVVAAKPRNSAPIETQRFKSGVEFPPKCSLQGRFAQNGLTSTVLSFMVCPVSSVRTPPAAFLTRPPSDAIAASFAS